MTKNLERIIILKIKNSDFFIREYNFQLFLFLELLNIYDYSATIMFVIDWSGITFDIIKTLDLKFVKTFIDFILVS